VLVPPGDDTALAREVDRLVSDDAERERLSEAARATVAANFTWERNGERTAALYRELAKLHGKGAKHGS
jgi:glycosyltransferase involved in cell wall biosynthesis